MAVQMSDEGFAALLAALSAPAAEVLAMVEVLRRQVPWGRDDERRLGNNPVEPKT